MSAEKQIRLRARKSLAPNWFVMITVVFLLSAVLVLIYALYYAVYYALGIKDINIVLSAVAAVGILFVSPLLNGFLKMAYNISASQNAEIDDVFYFFKNARRYFKTVLLNLILTGIFSITFIPDLLLYMSSVEFSVISIALLSIIKILAFFLFINYPIIAYSVDDSDSVSRYIFKFSFKKFISAVRLFVSFTGWTLLCFFVIPALYVLPYITVAMVDLVTKES